MRNRVPELFLLLVTLSGFNAGSVRAGQPTGEPAPKSTPDPAGQPSTILPDGTPVTTNPDGSKTSQYEPGSTYTQHPDGSKTIGETIKGPDGKPVKVDTTYKPDGTRIKSYPDDPTKKPEEEKPKTTLVGKRGHKSFTYEDGTTAKFGKDGKFEIQKPGFHDRTDYEYRADGSRRIDVHPDNPFKITSGGAGTSMTVALDNRPERLFSVAGNYAPAELTKNLKSNLQLSYEVGTKWKLATDVQYLGTMNEGDGGCNLFTAKTPEKISEPEFTKSIEAAIGSLGYRPCENFPRGELNFCTIFTPLTGFRGHDHAHHHGALHSHDAPDPPLDWGRKPSETIIRLNMGAGGK